jgi:hypothetical protein
VSTPFWGPDFDELQQVGPEIAGIVIDELERPAKAGHGTEAGDRELASVADEVSALVARTSAYARA